MKLLIPIVLIGLVSCRAWAVNQVPKYNSSLEGFDYECGKNCDMSGDKSFTCEKTLR